MPFENELVILELTENEFKGLLEYLLSRRRRTILWDGIKSEGW